MTSLLAALAGWNHNTSSWTKPQNEPIYSLLTKADTTRYIMNIQLHTHRGRCNETNTVISATFWKLSTRVICKNNRVGFFYLCTLPVCFIFAVIFIENIISQKRISHERKICIFLLNNRNVSLQENKIEEQTEKNTTIFKSKGVFLLQKNTMSV